MAVSTAAGPAGPNDPGERDGPETFRSPTDGIVDTPLELHRVLDAQHGPSSGHVPGSSENVELVAKFRVADAAPGRITDVWSHGDFAYLGTFQDPQPCRNTGVYVIDISDPEKPRQVEFIPGASNTRTNDVKVFHFETGSFSGDLLIHSNEPCSFTAPFVGGISLWDVTNPRDPEFLSTTGDFDLAQIIGTANGVHNLYAWQAGDRAFVAVVDDFELTDFDVFDITNPRNPVLVAETGLLDWPGARDAQSDGAGTFPLSFLHDVWVKRVGGRWVAYLSYWDAGVVLLDVSNPAAPTFLSDSTYPDPDPLSGFRPPEGNAHAAVPDRSGRYVLMGDEDFDPARTVFEITTGPSAGPYPAGELIFTEPIAALPDALLNGPVVFGGYGCDDDLGDIPAPTVLGPLAPGEEAIVVFQRGPLLDPNHDHDPCTFDEKVQNGANAGYDAVVIANHHLGSLLGFAPNRPPCGLGNPRPIPGLCVGHRALHLLFDRPEDYTTPYPVGDPGDLEPDPGDLGHEIRATVPQFDGWGYLHLLDAETLEEIDAFAPPEVFDPNFATGFGDLTMHNVEADPATDLAYISWYSLGLRVVRFGSSGLKEVGHYVDRLGSNYWGVHVHRGPGGERLILASDRDSGLWIFRFTARGCDARAGSALRGTVFAETLCGGRGADRLLGRGGDDVLRGAGGDDVLVGGPGNDLLVGGPGKDVCRGGPGDDALRGCEERAA